METRVRSRSKEVIISGDRRFVMIGERINPTGRKLLGAEMTAGRMDRVKADAIAQEDADTKLTHLPARIGQQLMPVVELDFELRIGQRIDDRTVHLDGVVLGHRREW